MQVEWYGQSAFRLETAELGPADGPVVVVPAAP
jgi:hypothetical protein